MADELLKVNELKERFVDVSEVMQGDLKKLVQFQLTNKSQAILRKIYSRNPDAKVTIEYTIIRNKQGKYEADFLFTTDGDRFITQSPQGFKIATDLVTHAFDPRKRHVLGVFGWKKLFK